MPYGHDDGLWEQTKAALRAELVGRARARSVVPYSALVARIGPIRFAPDSFNFHRMLGEVSEEEDGRGRGLLTVIVVHKDGDMRPEPGFFELADSRERDVADLDRAWLAELDKV